MVETKDESVNKFLIKQTIIRALSFFSISIHISNHLIIKQIETDIYHPYLVK